VSIQGAGGTLKTVCICSYVHVVGILMQDDVALVINAQLHVQLLVKTCMCSFMYGAFLCGVMLFTHVHWFGGRIGLCWAWG